jgi:NAD(P)-dependent dehydrogenase (short-subunit alcohol dehydrogenase family)
MNRTEKPCVVVTGASTGIGETCVDMLIGADFFVFGSVRRDEDAERLKQRFGDDFEALIFDVTDPAAIHAAAAVVESRLAGKTLKGLVNNAGVALPAPLLHQPLAEFRRQFEINVIGQLAVTQAFAPLLGAGPRRAGTPGRVVNMSSVAGSFAAPFLGAYAASKFALEGFSDALRRELMIYDVDVIVIEPGVIKTPIWDKAEAMDFGGYDSTEYGEAARRIKKWAVESGRSGAPAELVGAAVLRALKERRPPARIRVVPGYFGNWIVPRMLPTRLMDWLVARRLGFLALRASRRKIPD